MKYPQRGIETNAVIGQTLSGRDRDDTGQPRRRQASSSLPLFDVLGKQCSSWMVDPKKTLLAEDVKQWQRDLLQPKLSTAEN